MVEDFMTTYGSRLIIAVIGVGIGLLLLVVALYLIRRRNGPSPFLKGGKNRQPRLQVLDAAAVDARRRIVLIRRDDVEHLVMIGGPTDVVIESGIGLSREGVAILPEKVQAQSLSAPVLEPRLQKPERQAQLSAPVATPETAPAIQVRRDETPETRVASASQPTLTNPQPKATIAPDSTNVVKPEPPASRASAEVKTAPVQPAAQPSPVKEPEITHPAPSVAPAVASAKTVSVAPDIGSASDALDAARRRVFQPAQDKTPSVAVATPLPAAALSERRVEPSAPSVSDTNSQQSKTNEIASEFDRILEQEMASNLAAQKADFAPTLNAAPVPRPAAPTARVTGASTEPSLQNEIARIFGEMSVTKDDRQP